MSPARVPAVSNPAPRSQSSVISFGERGAVSRDLRPRVWTGASRCCDLVVRRRGARGACWPSRGAETQAGCRLPPRDGFRRKRWDGGESTPPPPALHRELPRARSVLASWLHHSTRPGAAAVGRTRRAGQRARAQGRPGLLSVKGPAGRAAPAGVCVSRPPPLQQRPGVGGEGTEAPPPGCRSRAGAAGAPCSPWPHFSGSSPRVLTGRVAQVTLPLSSTVWVRRRPAAPPQLRGPAAPSHACPACAARCPRAALADMSTAKTVTCPCGRDMARAARAGSQHRPRK